ncbi:kinase-like protein [Teratosphaeria destructans]|uniref:Kinase-like protein n=1 Tax=Teratosphaeria destructans TaxID=418781 RepID=A0A9W7W4L4_9PEZI|nr:kinase-like protein [Teratosphaeria destructans]
MEVHWEEVKELAKLLIYITKAVDKDGVDVAFLSSPKFVNFKRSNKAAQYIGRQHPADKTSLDTVLDQEVQNYCRKIDAYRNPVTIMPRSLRRRSLYILTNGLLEHGGPNQGHDAIETLVTKLVSASMGRAQFGIQFIRFGNHPDGIARLDAMDRLNQSRSLRR